MTRRLTNDLVDLIRRRIENPSLPEDEVPALAELAAIAAETLEIKQQRVELLQSIARELMSIIDEAPIIGEAPHVRALMVRLKLTIEKNGTMQ